MFGLPFCLGRHGAEIGRNRDPFMHHVRHGAAPRDLDPSASFDAAAYRRNVMAGDRRSWTGLTAHEMRVPLVHFLRGACTPTLQLVSSPRDARLRRCRGSGTGKCTT